MCIRDRIRMMMQRKKEKSELKTWKGQQKTNELQAKMERAVNYGYQIPVSGARQPNEAGRFCTESRTDDCVANAAVYCEVLTQNCVIKDPNNGDKVEICLLYTSDAADDLLCATLGGRRSIKKKQESEISDDSILFLDYTARCKS
eukprot:TRINITY_DN27995_c0_g1_i1.p1 TRINITY_DN27995_c0_g1~~TRINITY_DN27995_c0_g1_i1.p1  ORF type:complete len:145 (+),score=44.58 TRINITY_DN27995_c0_g1_i1:140-574(+)